MLQSYIKEELIMIYITVPSPEAAHKMASTLIEKQLAACVSIIPNIISIYRFKGEKKEYQEEQLLVKTRSSLFEKVLEEVKKIHSYVLPEFFSVKIEQASREYEIWINNETESKTIV